MEPHTARTLANLRDTLRLSKEVRQAALQRRNLDLVAVEDEAIARLEARIAHLEATAQRRADRTPDAAPPPAAPPPRAM